MRCLIASCIYDMHLLKAEGGLSTHRIPNDPVRQDRWLQVLSGMDCYFGKNARICSLHFRDSDFNVVNGKRRLKKEAVPSLFLFSSDENLRENGENKPSAAVAIVRSPPGKQLPFDPLPNSCPAVQLLPNPCSENNHHSISSRKITKTKKSILIRFINFLLADR